MQVIKVLGNEMTLNATPNTVSSAKLVRCVNSNTTTSHTLTFANAGGNTASVTIAPLDTIAVVKNPSDTLRVDAGSDVKAVSIAFGN